MKIDDPLVRDLLDPANLPAGAEKVEFKASHASFVFLAGESVFKVKRAKDYGFFDFRRIESRKHFCEEEVRLNRRLAPEVYLGVLPVYKDSAGFSFVRKGEIADYAVHMRRLPDEESALALLRAGRLRAADLDEAARVLARFYARAEAVAAPAGDIAENIRENFEQVKPYVGSLVDAAVYEATRSAQEAWLARHREMLALRPSKDGHGDLRLEHLYFRPGGVAIIDCIEFLDRFRIADPALDAAFLAMDLRFCGRADLAEHFLGRFAFESDDYDSYVLIDGYQSYRAWVRGKVSCFLASDPATDPETRTRKAAEATRFFELARRCMVDGSRSPIAVAVGGLIGSGKSTLAVALSRSLSAPIVSADSTRKSLAGLEHNAPGGPEIYLPAFTARVQAEFLRRAEEVLRSGRSVILDTSFSTRDLRSRARELALSQRARFLFIECKVPESVARERLRGRTGGISDAREDLYPTFRERFEDVRELSAAEHTVLDATRDPETLADEIAERFVPRGSGEVRR